MRQFLLLPAHPTPCHVLTRQWSLQGTGFTGGSKWPASPREKQRPGRNFLREPLLGDFKAFFFPTGPGKSQPTNSLEVSARYVLRLSESLLCALCLAACCVGPGGLGRAAACRPQELMLARSALGTLQWQGATHYVLPGPNRLGQQWLKHLCHQLACLLACSRRVRGAGLCNSGRNVDRNAAIAP